MPRHCAPSTVGEHRGPNHTPGACARRGDPGGTPDGLAPISWTPGLSCRPLLRALPLEGPGTEIPERRMTPLPVVEDLDVLEQRGAGRGPRLPRSRRAPVRPSPSRRSSRPRHCPSNCPAGSCCTRCLQRRAPAGSRRWRTGCPDRSDAASPWPGRRWTSAMSRASSVSSRVMRSLIAQPDDDARAEIEDHGQVQPAFARRDVGDVGHPRPVGRRLPRTADPRRWAPRETGDASRSSRGIAADAGRRARARASAGPHACDSCGGRGRRSSAWTRGLP